MSCTSCAGAVGISGGEWSASWELTKSSKVVYLLGRLQDIGAAPPPPAAAASGEPALLGLSWFESHTIELCSCCRIQAESDWADVSFASGRAAHHEHAVCRVQLIALQPT